MSLSTIRMRAVRRTENFESFRTASIVENAQDMAVSISPEQYEIITRHLAREPYYHGRLSRGSAEALIHNDGQFLIRESPNVSGQIVLTGQEDGRPKHLCLIDAYGQVSEEAKCGLQQALRNFQLQTSVGCFTSVVQLVKFYIDHRCQLTTASSALYLTEPVSWRSF